LTFDGKLRVERVVSHFEHSPKICLIGGDLAGIATCWRFFIDDKRMGQEGMSNYYP